MYLLIIDCLHTWFYGRKIFQKTIINNLLIASDNDVARAERGIIYIDEIDKIARGRDSFGRFRASGFRPGRFFRFRALYGPVALRLILSIPI